MKIPKKNGGRFKSMNYSFLVEFGLLFDNETIDGQLFDSELEFMANLSTAKWL